MTGRVGDASPDVEEAVAAAGPASAGDELAGREGPGWPIGEAGPMPGAPDAPGKGWGHFRRLWTATAVSSLGDGVRLSAMPLLAVSLTSDPVLLSLVVVAGTAPLLLSSLAGVWADLRDRRALLITVDIARAGVILLLAAAVVTGTASLWLVALAAALLGLGETVFVIAAQTFLPMVVDGSRLPAANGRLHVAQLIFRDTIGYPLGAAMFVVGAALPFLLDGASFLIGVVLLLGVHTVTASPGRPAGHRLSWRTMTAEGVRYLRADRLLLGLAMMLGLLNFFVAAIGTLQVLYVIDWLELPKGVFGLFLVAGAAGGVTGGMATERLSLRFGLFPAALGGLGLIGVSCLALGVQRHPIVAGAAFATLHLGIAVYQALTVSFRQHSTSPEILGRITGVYRLIGTGTVPIGAVVAGSIAKLTAINVPFLVSGIGICLLGLVTTRPLLGAAARRTEPRTAA